MRHRLGRRSDLFTARVDQKVYLDLSFFEDLRARFGAPGDFAQAYVIAMRWASRADLAVASLRRWKASVRKPPLLRPNQLSVRMVFAGRLPLLEFGLIGPGTQISREGDVEEGLNAASAIGDDRMQKRGQGYVVPDAFTHGSSAQRVRWFSVGLRPHPWSL